MQLHQRCLSFIHHLFIIYSLVSLNLEVITLHVMNIEAQVIADSENLVIVAYLKKRSLCHYKKYCCFIILLLD